MSTDWWSPGQRWLEKQASKEAESQKRAWVKGGRSSKTFRYNPPEWHRDAVAALGRNDEETFKAIKLDRLGTRGLPPLSKRHHATKKKSPAQLQREIDEALSGTSRQHNGGKPPPPLHSSISNYEQIRAAIARFPATFGLRGFPGDVFRISPTSSYVSGGRVMLYTERKDNDDWLDFSKGTESELRGEVTSLASTGSRSHSTKAKKPPLQGRVVGRHGLGTADVRTGEGAYWIVRAPTGYRVDYKPWGPSSEVDLGTFSSRSKARAKITTHAGSVGATIVS